MDDYVDVTFDITVTESSSLTNKEILFAVCSVKEQNDTEDERQEALGLKCPC